MSEGKDRMDISGGLVDAGWEQMHEILDREMPQRRRKALVWWLLAGLIIVVTGGVVAFNQWSDKVNKQDSLLVEIQQLNNEVPDVLQEIPESQPAKSPQDDIADQTIPSEGLVTDPRRSPAGSVAQAKVTKSPAVAPKQKLEAGFSSIGNVSHDDDQQPVNVPSQVGREGPGDAKIKIDNPERIGKARSEKAATVDEKQEATSLLPERARFSRLDPLSTRSATLLVEQDRAADVLGQVQQKRSKPRLDFAIRADLLSDFGLARISGGGGLELQLHLGQRVSIASGISYWKFTPRQEIYASQNSLADEEVFVSDCCDAGLTNNVDAEDERLANQRVLLADVDQHKFHFIEIPIRLSYRIAPRWDVQLGVQWIKSFDQISNTSEKQDFVAAPQFAAVDASSAELYRTSNFSYSAGFRYRLNRRFFVDARFSRAMKHHLNYQIADGSSGPSGNLHHRIRMGVGYRIGAR